MTSARRSDPPEDAPIGHVDSVEEEEADKKKSQKKQKSRRPANTAFRQQRLKAWQPILTPKTVLPIFFAVGIIFAPIGGLLLWASATVQELVIDYTDCNTTATSEFQQIPDSKVSMSFSSSNSISKPQWRLERRSVRPPYSAVNISDTAVCTLQFSIPGDINPPVYLYYRLTNFYQNHRRYVRSLDTSQLKGSALDNGTIDGSACDPLRMRDGKAIYPCGLIANSIFNDTINSPVFTSEAGGEDPTVYRMTNRSIAWGSDAELYQKTDYRPDQVSPPPNWAERFPDGYTNESFIDLSEYEEFHVWMRTAGLPTFSKLALRNDDDVLRAGTYQLEIYDYFPTHVYDGTKSILLSTRTVVGGKNSFLGIAYVVVAGICVVIGVVFTLAHLIKPRRLGDHTYLSWNNADLPSTATTTGRDNRPQGA